ncbi:sensor histidine kinase [Novosphingobium piscinae]|uniref:Uncharacterized protein n=1 Tax=Novosphingobium piscinae TaxID=1507448 RepID=A0A7X1KP83_9SPHN|nr:hypothetical protein [Novosphingobium piscinae]MBC2668474.1 hypothetical protein [Novosphingobium piscinae]
MTGETVLLAARDGQLAVLAAVPPRSKLDLLDMLRIERRALHEMLEPVDLVEAAAAAAHDMRRVLADLPESLAIPPDLPLVRVDARLLHHCLINLLDNAAKYGPPRQPIELTARIRAALRH